MTFVESEWQLKRPISTKSKDTFALWPKRWMVERTFAWLRNFRRRAKEVNILTETAENIISVSMRRPVLDKLR